MLRFDITLEYCLFSAVELTKNADISKYKYSEYCTENEFFHILVVDLVTT